MNFSKKPFGVSMNPHYGAFLNLSLSKAIFSLLIYLILLYFVLYAHQASVTNARTIPGEKPSRK
jgi:Ca2+/H+ antiporter